MGVGFSQRSDLIVFAISSRAQHFRGSLDCGMVPEEHLGGCPIVK